VIEDRSVEIAKRAAAVNVEIIKANSNLKQQLRISKAQVEVLTHPNECLHTLL